MNSRWMYLRRGLAGSLVLGMGAALAACGSGSSSSPQGEEASDECATGVKISVGHVWPDSDPQAQAVVAFADKVSESAGGAVELDIFPAGQLGGDTEILEAVTLGSTDMWIGGAGVYNSLTSTGEFFVTPFMFDSPQEAATAYAGELGDTVIERLDSETDVKSLGFWNRGPRHITSNKPLNTPEDMTGLKIRTPENPMFVAGFEAMGASPTPMAFTEVFTALQQGVIDAQENPLALIESSGFSEVQKYLNLTSHVIEPIALTISKDKWSDLCEIQQQALQEAASEVGVEFLEQVESDEIKFRDMLEDEGMTIIHPDIDAFREAASTVREDVGADYADLYAIVDSLK